MDVLLATKETDSERETQSDVRTLTSLFDGHSVETT